MMLSHRLFKTNFLSTGASSSRNRLISTFLHGTGNPTKAAVAAATNVLMPPKTTTCVNNNSCENNHWNPRFCWSSTNNSLFGSTANVRTFASSAGPPLKRTKTSKDEIELAKIVRKIKADLLEADVNRDGRIDSEELKLILRKYPGVFQDSDVIEIGELFYTSRGGESVSHERFMAAINNAIYHQTPEEMVEDGIQHRRMGSVSHPLGLGTCSTEYMYGKSRGVYSDEELDVKLTHVEPKTTSDKIAKAAVGVVRFCFDTVSMWNHGDITQAKVLRRVIFLETVAGIPGFVAAMNRHFRSLRTFTRDGGMLNMFLDEANNERMHLLSFVRMRDPGIIMRFVVLGSQAVVGVAFLTLYAFAPNFCHRFVGYIEEEACHTYTKIIQEIESAPEARDLSEWRTQLAPKIARGYWHLGEDGTVLDMMYAIRADEAEHRDVNHQVSGLAAEQGNPLYNPEEKFDQFLKKYVESMLKRGHD